MILYIMIGMGEWGLSLHFDCVTRTQVAALKDAHLSTYRLLFQFPFHACESICAAAQLLLLHSVCCFTAGKDESRVWLGSDTATASGDLYPVIRMMRGMKPTPLLAFRGGLIHGSRAATASSVLLPHGNW